ncbi:MAG TPA: acyltransferase, partial [Bradyrhizobium sp.]
DMGSQSNSTLSFNMLWSKAKTGQGTAVEQKLEGLQAARAVAALSVAYFHSYIALRGFPEAAQLPIGALKDRGYLGVNFFFAISGYVICLVAAKPTFEPTVFAIKRLFRLYPMYWIAMMIIAAMIGLGRYSPQSLDHFLYSMTLLPQQGAPAYDPSWTLEREMVFYVLAAIVVPFAGARGLAVVLATLAACGWYFGNPWSFHLISTTQADFLAGVLVFLVRERAKLLGAVVPIAIGCAGLWFSRTHELPFLVPASMAIVLLGMTQLRLPWERPPFRWVVAIGDVSYSIYLLHYIVFYWSAFTSARLPWTLPDWLCEPWRYLALALCCLISSVTWRYIEFPAIRFSERIARHKVPFADNQRSLVARQ